MQGSAEGPSAPPQRGCQGLKCISTACTGFCFPVLMKHRGCECLQSLAEFQFPSANGISMMVSLGSPHLHSGLFWALKNFSQAGSGGGGLRAFSLSVAP